MNKQLLTKIFLILLPAMAVVLATTGDSVMVYDKAAETTSYASYFVPVNAGGLTLLPPLAAILAIVTTVLGIVYAITRKNWCIRGVIATGFVSATAATVPVLMQGEMLVVPNPMLPILMLAACAVAVYASKKPAEEKVKHGPRLS